MNGTTEQLSNKLGINKVQLFEWKNTIIRNINFQIKKYRNKLQNQNFQPFWNNTTVKEGSGKHQHDFAVIPNYQAANNVSFMCKIFYATTLLKKIGLLGITNRNKLISDYNINILFNSVVNRKIKQQFSMSVPENITVVSTSYWILKMYEP